MKPIRFLWQLVIAAAMCHGALAQTAHMSMCSLHTHPKRFLNTKVEVEALVFAGIEYPRLTEGKCSFRYAMGDDYQSFGKLFPVRGDSDWKLLHEFLGKSDCASNVRVARAKLAGTIIRVPATGTIPPNEMPLELVIQSVSEVERVPVKCTPRRGWSM